MNMNRINISYDDIVSIGITLIKDETEMIFECNEKEKAETAIRISAIIDFISRLDDATQVTKGYQE